VTIDAQELVRKMSSSAFIIQYVVVSTPSLPLEKNKELDTNFVFVLTVFNFQTAMRITHNVRNKDIRLDDLGLSRVCRKFILAN
jgi:hypothetical protein